MEKCNLIIVGDSAFAEVAYEYFTHDSSYHVVAFAVESAFRKRDSLLGLPVVDFETLETSYSPESHDIFVATVYTQMNRLRTRLLSLAKGKGYKPASYISSQAFIWHNVELGEHCFIFEDNTVQPFVRLGNNVVLWSGNHIGHHTVIRDNCFISSHVVISGFCEIGESCFLGVNATVVNNITIKEDCWIGPGALIVKDVEAKSFYKTASAEPAKVTTHKYFKIKK